METVATEAENSVIDYIWCAGVVIFEGIDVFMWAGVLWDISRVYPGI